MKILCEITLRFVTVQIHQNLDYQQPQGWSFHPELCLESNNAICAGFQHTSIQSSWQVTSTCSSACQLYSGPQSQLVKEETKLQFHSLQSYF